MDLVPLSVKDGLSLIVPAGSSLGTARRHGLGFFSPFRTRHPMEFACRNVHPTRVIKSSAGKHDPVDAAVDGARDRLCGACNSPGCQGFKPGSGSLFEIFNNLLGKLLMVGFAVLP
jgi:hypothetical protein